MSRQILEPGPRLDPVESPTGAPVPVTLLTGFLGAGKTTLVNRILNGDHGLNVGVLVNDFGAVNIDAALVEGVEENTIALTNGCVCCEVRDDLVASLESLLTTSRDIEYVIIEASGIADPEGVVMTLSDQKYQNLLALDSVTCVVDADGLSVDDPHVALLKLRQIGFSDLVVLNKVDLVGPEYVRAVEAWIGQHFRRIRIIEAEYADVPLGVLLSVGRFEPGRDVAGLGRHLDVAFQSWRFASDEPMQLERLREVIRRLPATVYRCKGFVFDVDDRTQRTLVQAVGRRVSFTRLGEWGEERGRADIVVIGQDLDEQSLGEAFGSCVYRRQR